MPHTLQKPLLCIKIYIHTYTQIIYFVGWSFQKEILRWYLEYGAFCGVQYLCEGELGRMSLTMVQFLLSLGLSHRGLSSVHAVLGASCIGGNGQTFIFTHWQATRCGHPGMGCSWVRQQTLKQVTSGGCPPRVGATSPSLNGCLGSTSSGPPQRSYHHCLW